MNTKASILRRKQRLTAPEIPPSNAAPNPTSDKLTLADVIAFSPEQLPNPWLYNSDALIRDLDRIRELVQLIPIHTDTYSPTNVAIAAVWDLRTKLLYLIDLHKKMQRSWRDKATQQQNSANCPSQDAGRH